MKLNEADYRLIEQWLEKHRAADYIEFDKETELPVRAVYFNPVYQIVATEKAFFAEVAARMAEEE